MSTSRAIANKLHQALEEAAPRLKTIDPEAASRKPSDTAWSAKEILGHLLDSAVNNQQRFVRAQQVRDLHFPGYEQTFWVRCQRYSESEWHELVDLWYLFNRHLSQVIRHIPENALDTPCTLGTSQPVTLGFIAEDYLAHMQRHLEQLYERCSAD